jgi:hypothetical protein
MGGTGRWPVVSGGSPKTPRRASPAKCMFKKIDRL